MNMDKKSKEALRRYKRVKQARSSSDSSSSSDSDSGSSSSYSSSDSERRRRHKKLRQPTAPGSSTDDERRKREKREHCQKRLEAKRNHIKRKLKEAKLKKKAAAAAAALSGHSHRALSPSTQAKLRKLAERKHLRAASKEKREREKHRASARERERDHHRVNSRSPTKITKIRIHQDVKRQKSPPRMHHQLMSREKIIIQTRNRERSPSVDRERQRYEHKMRHEEMLRDRERREREVARDKERAEALARCQERQRERERLAREKLRREEEEKYGKAASGERERLLPRQAEREMAIQNRAYTSRERSLERPRRELEPYHPDHAYLRKHREGNDYLREDGHERHPHIEREEMVREREYMVTRHRELSPDGYGSAGPGTNRMRGDIRGDMYNIQEERDRPYKRPYGEDNHGHVVNHERWLNERDIRERSIHEQHEYKDMEPKPHFFRDERDQNEVIRGREEQPFIHRPPEWKHEWTAPHGEHGEWVESGVPSNNMERGGMGFVGGPKRPPITPVITKILPNRERPPSEPDWDMEEGQIENTNKLDVNNRREGPLLRDWVDHNPREMTPQLRQEKLSAPIMGGKPHRPPWTPDWRETEDPTKMGNFQRPPLIHRPHSERGGRGGFRRGGGIIEHGGRMPNIHMHGFRPRGHGPLLNLPMPPYHGGPHVQRFPFKRSLTYTNPNILKKQQAALAAATTAVAAAKAAAQSAANATTNPGILSQMGQTNTRNPFQQQNEKTETEEASDDGNNKQQEQQNEQPENENQLTIIKSEVNANENENSNSNSNATAIENANEEKATGELSEISDSDDDILNKNERKIKVEVEDTSSQEGGALNQNTNEDKNKNENENENNNEISNGNEKIGTEDKEEKNIKFLDDKVVADDDILDFEEISDGELEEEAKTKGVADALGVDWASLVAETKRLPKEPITTAKQKWQPYRILLDVGVSMHMAGEEYAKRILTEAQKKLDEETATNNKIYVKKEFTTKDKDDKEINNIDGGDNPAELKQPTETKDIKMESKPLDTNLAGTDDTKEIKTESKPLEIKLDSTDQSIGHLHPLACVQVRERKLQMKRRNLIANACGMNSRALSARQDLQLRRQLCGLPARECDFVRNIPPPSEQLKALALAAFRRTLEVK